MLGKQWLNRYLRGVGGSMIERCGDRQRKCNGLQKWPFHFFIESLPVMLQIALLLFACGLCRYTAFVNTSVAGVLNVLTALGVLFYAGIVIAGTSSYDCPFQTPASGTLRSLWAKLKPYLMHASLPIITVLYNLGEIVQCHIFRIAIRLPHVDIRHHFRSQLERVQLEILHMGLRLPWTGLNIRRGLRHPPLPTIQENPHLTNSKEVDPWLTSKDLATIQMTSTNDAWCVSWILRNITDPEALDAAIRLAGTIWWFEHGIDAEPPYDIIVSAFRANFGSDGKVYPGSRDRAYYSGRAILWIHSLAMCKPEFARSFPLPKTRYTTPYDSDFANLLQVIQAQTPGGCFGGLLSQQGCTPSHLRWTSNVLVHLSWANRTMLDYHSVYQWTHFIDGTTTSVDTFLGRILMWCIILGSPFEEEVLKVQNKSCETTCFLLSKLMTLSFTSDFLERILRQLSNAIVSALNTPHPQYRLIEHVLRYLDALENRPRCLTEMAYEWCSVICRNRSRGDWEAERLVLRSLEIGFRHINPPRQIQTLTHTEHHRGLPDIVFKSKESEAVADFLQAWTMIGATGIRQTSALLSMCTEYLVDLHNMVPFSPRLRQLFVRSVELIGYKRFAEGGAERFVELLNNLRIGVEDMVCPADWMSILLDTIQSPEGARSLFVQSWELLAELTSSLPWGLEDSVYSPQVTASLLEAQEWEKLECWMGVVWMVWPPQTDTTTKALEDAMVLLFRQRPGAVQKLTRWMERWSERGSQGDHRELPGAFERICRQPTGEAQPGAP
jgi:hypothetical protein